MKWTTKESNISFYRFTTGKSAYSLVYDRLKDAPTYLPFFEKDRKYVLSNIEKLVIKDVAEAGGYGVVFGRDMDSETLAGWRDRISKEPRRFIVQEVIDFVDLPVMDGTLLRNQSRQSVQRYPSKDLVFA